MKAGGYRMFFLESSNATVMKAIKDFHYDVKFHLHPDSKQWDCNGYRVGYLRPSKRNRINTNIRERTIAQEKVRTCISELFSKKRTPDVPRYSLDADFPGAIKDVNQFEEKPNTKID